MKVILLLLFFNLSSHAEYLEIKALKSNCEENVAGQLFVSSQKEPNKMIYQIELPLNGSVKLNLPKEKYKLSYITKNGCDGQLDVNLEKDMSIQMTVSKKE